MGALRLMGNASLNGGASLDEKSPIYPIYPILPIFPIKQQFIEKSPHFLLIIGLSFVTLHVVYVYIYNNGHKPPTFAQNTKQTIIH